MSMDTESISKRLQDYSGWEYDGKQLVKEYVYADFKAVMNFVNKVAEAAEFLQHHPDIYVYGWNHVRLSVSTHDANGVTEKDFLLISQIENFA